MSKDNEQQYRIAPFMDEPLRAFAQLIRDLGGDDALALTLFGAVLTDGFDRRQDTARSVLVVRQIDLSMLWRISEHGTKLGKDAIAAPLIMTPEYLTSSLDVFPLELLNIQQRHLVLFGTDYFNDLNFEPQHIRLQCERELKTLLIGLRQGLLAAAGKEKLLEPIELDASEGLMRTMRGILWLKSDRQPRPALEVLTAIEKLIDRKLDGLRLAIDLGAHHGWNEFVQFYRDVEALGAMVDVKL
jgi:hypothetical protein